MKEAKVHHETAPLNWRYPWMHALLGWNSTWAYVVLDATTCTTRVTYHFFEKIGRCAMWMRGSRPEGSQHGHQWGSHMHVDIFKDWSSKQLVHNYLSVCVRVCVRACVCTSCNCQTCRVTSAELHCTTTTLTLPCLTLYALLKIKIIKLAKTTNTTQSVTRYGHYQRSNKAWKPLTLVTWHTIASGLAFCWTSSVSS